MLQQQLEELLCSSDPKNVHLGLTLLENNTNLNRPPYLDSALSLIHI